MPKHPRHAALDREHSKVDRDASHDDWVALNEALA
jgi:hypothetical protein